MLVGQTKPQIEELNVGIRKIRTIKVYPVSVMDQANLTEIIAATLKEFYTKGGKEGLVGNSEKKSDIIESEETFEEDSEEPIDKLDEGNIAFAEFLTDLVKENVVKIIKLTTDENEELLNELSNNQLVEYAWIIYRMNYQDAKKKLVELYLDIKGIRIAPMQKKKKTLKK